MSPIQVLLVLCLTAACLIIVRTKNRLTIRLSITLGFIVGAILITNPGLATKAAHLLGVGRGADLVSYLGLSGLLFLCLHLYGQYRFAEQRLTKVIRRLAVLEWSLSESSKELRPAPNIQNLPDAG